MEKLWDKFYKTGYISDYLKYKGQNIESVNSDVINKGGQNYVDNSRGSSNRGESIRRGW